MTSLLRNRAEGSEVTNGELFFDLVYVFAVTQISHLLVEHPTVHGALDSALLLAMVWIVWVYTTWVANWLDPDRTPTRVVLMIVMLGSLVMTVGLPDAFGDRGLWVGGAYAAMQIGRSAYTAWALGEDESLRRNFLRILAWCVVSGACALVGGLAHGHARELWWLAAVAVDSLGGLVGFWTPGLGRSETHEWTIDGGHFAERCQGFLIIALGESIVATGSAFAAAEHQDVTSTSAFVFAFAGAVALWWLYFDRRAREGVDAITASDDPGRLATRAYHFVHPLMVAGIIVTAAGDENVVEHPGAHAAHGTAWFVAGGTALFLLGHALFVWLVRGALPVVQAIGFAVLVVLGATGSRMPSLAVGAVTLAVVVVVVALDWRASRAPARAG